ncbi:MAG: ComEC/Rec2 family competence protein [Intestinibacter bartlettii]|uniref:ComEC/Rec2 family competence protein n=1 Tax=Intestinibacter bartlettii TaxID=261299 RepID=UPI0026EBCE7F|nr:ComEC/Rec2 family competence protein [Intestinibacter bartlettii]MDO5009980.1 ComEC/Rec2 family competence protein [Intestinibacter bartlettii]
MNKKILIFSIIIITLLVGCNKNKDFCVHIIDVGQADSILITTPSNQNMLIDGGDEDSAKIIKSYLKNKKIKNLDVVVATHPDSDHIGSLDYIIDNFDVEKIYMPKQSTDSECYINLIESCNKKNLKVNYLSKDDSFNLDTYTKIYVLSPNYITDNNNSNSIVLNISYKNNNFLFTGDCEESNEMDIINSYDLKNTDFLKVAHHGSSTSSSLAFLEETTPDIAVISCGYKNSYGHPHRSTLDNLESVNSKVFRTDINGSMQFYSDGNKIYSTVKYKEE